MYDLVTKERKFIADDHIWLTGDGKLMTKGPTELKDESGKILTRKEVYLTEPQYDKLRRRDVFWTDHGCIGQDWTSGIKPPPLRSAPPLPVNGNKKKAKKSAS